MPVFLGTQSEGQVNLAPSDENQSAKISVKAQRRRRTADSILRAMGEDALFNGYLSVRVIHRTDVERIGEAGEFILDSHQIAFNGAHIPFARIGGQFTLNNRVYTLKTKLTRSKEGLQVWVVK